MKVLVATIILCLCTASSFAQSGFGKLFGDQINGGKAGRTIIDSSSIEMNNKDNIVIFKGEVVVNSPRIHITCERMELYMKTTTVEGKRKRVLEEIRCFKNIKGNEQSSSDKDKRVIIIRKFPEAELQEEKEQKSISGKAVYNIITGKIVLTDKPVMVQGMNEIYGSKITVWRDSEVMDVIDGRVRYIDENDESTKTPF